MNETRNIYEITQPVNDQEVFDVLTQGNVKIERIISTGQVTPEGEWLVQDNDEWVVLLDGEAKLSFEDVGEINMAKGDYVLIKANERHRVTYTSQQPPCIWIAVHGNLTMN